MKIPSPISSFGSVYLRLALVALISILAVFAVSRGFIAPKVISNRAEAVYSLIRSQDRNLVLNDTRALRDELIRSGTISTDQNFSHFLPEEKAAVTALLKSCSFVSPTICLGREMSVFLAPAGQNLSNNEFKYAVSLSADLRTNPPILYLYEGLAALVLFALFYSLYVSILKMERSLSDRLKITMSAFSDVEEIFSDSKAKDGLAALEYSVTGLAEKLKASKRDIARYKQSFETRTRLEQLGLTIGQVSHDLKAPLNEADNFLTSLPLLLQKAAPSDIETATKSLIQRIRHGKSALDSALQTTKQSVFTEEVISVSSILQSVKSRAAATNNLRDLKLDLEIPTDEKIRGNQLRLETALLNLLENTADEKPSASVRISAKTEDAGLRIVYEDNGRGIAAENLQTIFSPLVSFKENGTGLGLSSTDDIVSSHGGGIKAVAKSGGARFEILLPSLVEVTNA